MTGATAGRGKSRDDHWQHFLLAVGEDDWEERHGSLNFLYRNICEGRREGSGEGNLARLVLDAQTSLTCLAVAFSVFTTSRGWGTHLCVHVLTAAQYSETPTAALVTFGGGSC